MKPPPRQHLWLAGWHYLLTENNGRFLFPGKPPTDPSRRTTQALPWPQAATWLRDEIHHTHQHWTPTPVHTWHRITADHLERGPFPDAPTFITWALEHRQNQGIWGRDNHRCYYLITADEKPHKVR